MEQLSETDAPSSSTAADYHGDGRSDAMAKGLSTMIESIIKQFDSKANDTLNSQNQLTSSLDRLIQELDQLLENAPLPFIVQHASRISSVKQRVSSMNLMLKSIQRRLDNIDHMLSANINTTQEKTTSETTS